MGRNTTHQLALCGVLTATASALLLMGGMIPLATFCAPLLAMLILLPVLEEFGPRMALTAYAATALLGLLLAADREMALVYLFFGWYPVLRPRIAALHSKLLRLLSRLAVCNGALFLLYGVALRFLGLEGVETGSGEILLNLTLLLMGNTVFFLTDLVLCRMTWLWRRRLRKHVIPR